LPAKVAEVKPEATKSKSRPVMLALRRLRVEKLQFKVSLGYVLRPFPKQKKERERERGKSRETNLQILVSTRMYPIKDCTLLIDVQYIGNRLTKLHKPVVVVNAYNRCIWDAEVRKS
jgi:hypothetical protein